jgi:hypothetical protein
MAQSGQTRAVAVADALSASHRICGTPTARHDTLHVGFPYASRQSLPGSAPQIRIRNG